jgi:hypothetical protein
MRRLAFIIALFAALTVTVVASADVPAPAVAACQAEYAQLGPSAFAAKYGPTEPWGHCYAQHTPTKTTTDSPAAAACKAEYVQLGPSAFAAKYGGQEALGQCVRLHATQKPPQPTMSGAATSVATAFCQALARTLGKDAFLAKYGPKEALGNCVRMSLANARSLVASCQASSGTSKDAFRACLAAGLQPRRR